MTHSQNKLRFVLLCDGQSFPAWQAACLRELMTSGLADIVLLIVKSDETLPKRRRSAHWKGLDLLLWRLFDRFYVRRACEASRPVDLREELENTPVRPCTPIRTGRFGETFSAADIEAIAETRPDVILRFGFGILKGDILDIARYGLWSYHHGDPAAYRGQPPGFWEIYDGKPVTGSILQILNEKLDSGTILHAGFFQTQPHSYAKTRDDIYMGSAPWVRRTCAEILNGHDITARHNPDIKWGKLYKTPKNHQMVAFLCRTAIAYCRNQIKHRFFRQQWTCGVVDAPIHIVAGLSGTSVQTAALSATRWMPEPKRAFAADPFVIPGQDDSDNVNILFEYFDETANIGRIASVTYSEANGFGPITEKLRLPTHLSYPYVFASKKVTFCVPENSENGSLHAYVLTDPDGELSQPAKISDLPIIDPTIIEWNGRYWMFCQIDTWSRNSDLYIFHADAPAGPWQPHALNPVKTDVRSARPAGTPFVHDGKLYRPAQDCSVHYGARTAINLVETLSETRFCETPIAFCKPPPGSRYPNALHTVVEAGGKTVIDGARLKLSFAELRLRIRRLWSR